MIQLNYRDSRPIYEQIKDGLRRLMISGAIPEGERLPSVRRLAAALTINPNTIQRAYTELEGEGYVSTVTGKGSFACRQVQTGTGRLPELFCQFDRAAAELLFWGIEPGELSGRIAGISGKKEEEQV
ncbi:GntR family transcriptional regulator [Papillibacter cinnamivorans]|uniref:GntR family transcriptional regulator n=1 Tax=Papillibacter cinnamivorans DSM 12816 TaxID=1122930 RepID=A0A1W1ZYX9_9FIRM|nr:GntR family transcriptional regulator [Papillibacter cinnamivorans]SMC53566.1 GntR family transcriptional regulator [Papillibacter cinnamivorans DSM 12816]